MNILELPGPIGAEVHDLDVRQTTTAIAELLAACLLRRLIVIIQNQPVSSEEHVRLSMLFGSLEKFPIRPNDPNPPDYGQQPWEEHIFRVSNNPVHGYTQVGMYWHTDGYFHREPTAVSIMRPVVLPAQGGDTWFANMYRAYETLPHDLKSQVDRSVAVSHAAPGARAGSLLFRRQPTTAVRHPLVRPHPVTGRSALYLNVGNIASVDGLTQAESQTLIKRLVDHVADGPFRYCHRWQPGQIVLWDNGAAAHRATPLQDDSLRIMERTTVEGSEYFRGAFWKGVGRGMRDSVEGAAS